MDPSLAVAALAGAVGGGILLAGRAVSMRVDPRPCWQKTDCTMRRGNPESCAVCPVYVYRDTPAATFLTPELNLPPLRNFVAEGIEVSST